MLKHLSESMGSGVLRARRNIPWAEIARIVKKTAGFAGARKVHPTVPKEANNPIDLVGVCLVVVIPTHNGDQQQETDSSTYQ